MVVFPNAKINLGLHILLKRDDGYHELETGMMPVGWCDVIDIVKAPDKAFAFTQTGIRIYGPSENNLCVKAWKLMHDLHGIGPVHMHLHKVVPTGAGLGGGSSDAAFTLRALNQLFSLQLPDDILEEYGARLGSDCAFFIRNIPRMATGRGERFRNLPKLSLPLYIVIVKPKAGVRTTDAYKQVSPGKPVQPLADVLKRPAAQWKKMLANDFEPSVFKQHPSLPKLREKLYQLGAVYAAMSGSGSAIFGLFDKPVEAAPHFRGSTTWQGTFAVRA